MENGLLHDLAPSIHRQRLVIEGLPSRPIDDAAIREYLTRMSRTIDMVPLMEPVTHRSPTYGWSGWIHWETSGAHFYAWDIPLLFFSADIYACKPFSVEAALELTRRFFDTDVEYKEF
jgi:S-adenosylmethionine decarboxylase